MTSSYLRASLRISALRASTVFCARSIALATVLDSIGHVLGQGAAHDPAHGAGGEEAEQLVVEAQVEAALARVALAARAAPQLVVDAPALVALAAEHVEARRACAPPRPRPGSAPRWRPAGAPARPAPPRSSRSTPSAASSCWASSSGLPPRMMSTPRPAMLVATVTAPAARPGRRPRPRGSAAWR